MNVLTQDGWIGEGPGTDAKTTKEHYRRIAAAKSRELTMPDYAGDFPWAHEKGWNAAKAGWPETLNPFMKKNGSHYAWRNGWRAFHARPKK